MGYYRSKRESFLLGMSQVLDIGGTVALVTPPHEADSLEAIREDFQKVGECLRSAMSTVAQEADLPVDPDHPTQLKLPGM